MAAAAAVGTAEPTVHAEEKAAALPAKTVCTAAAQEMLALLVAVARPLQAVLPVATGAALRPVLPDRADKAITAAAQAVAVGLAVAVPAMAVVPAVPTMPTPTCVPALHIPAAPAKGMALLPLTIHLLSVPVLGFLLT